MQILIKNINLVRVVFIVHAVNCSHVNFNQLGLNIIKNHLNHS